MAGQRLGSGSFRATGGGARPTALVALSMAGLVVGGMVLAFPEGLASATGDACTSLASAYPTLATDSGFQRACVEPTFVAAYQEWGASNFSVGGLFTPAAGAHTYYEFYWSGSCTGSQWGPSAHGCGHQEYWDLNRSSGQVTGPYFQEDPPICECPSLTAYPPPVVRTVLGPVPLVPLAIVGGLALFFGWREIRRRRRPPSESSGRIDALGVEC